MGMGDQFETMLKEFVEEAVNEIDLDDKVSDAVKEYVGDLDDKVSDEVDNKLADAVKEEVADQIKDAVHEEVGDEIGDLDEKISEAVDTALNAAFETPEFEESIRKVLMKIVGGFKPPVESENVV